MNQDLLFALISVFFSVILFAAKKVKLLIEGKVLSDWKSFAFLAVHLRVRLFLQSIICGASFHNSAHTPAHSSRSVLIIIAQISRFPERLLSRKAIFTYPWSYAMIYHFSNSFFQILGNGTFTRCREEMHIYTDKIIIM